MLRIYALVLSMILVFVNCEDFYETYYEEPVIDESSRSAVRWDMFKWPRRIIPYAFSDEYTAEDKTDVRNALKVFSEKTCMRFEPRDPALHGNSRYVNFGKREDICGTKVGYQMGAANTHDLYLNKNCLKLPAAIQHESMHAMGIFHEQSRSDRDQYVEILWGNIEPRTMQNFMKTSEIYASGYGLPYDYGSVMHYPGNAFAIKGKNVTMRPRKPKGDPSMKLGQMDGPSDIDIQKINRLYNCPEFEMYRNKENVN